MLKTVKIAILIRTMFKLRTGNIFRMILYKLSLKTCISGTRRLAADIPPGDFFRLESNLSNKSVAAEGKVFPIFFGWYQSETSFQEVPNWHRSFLTCQSVTDPSLPWWGISDFDSGAGDIKTIWEISRFNWLLKLAQLVKSGDESAISTMNHWLADWVEKNPPYLGPNWKCGQESSIRILNTALSAAIIGQHDNPRPALIMFVRAHLKRVASTIQYSIAQQNNHAVSEAAGLFVGGSWLAHINYPEGKKYYEAGLNLLERSARDLIESDGSFSQHSVTYHRLVTNIYSVVEYWRRLLDLPTFNLSLYERLRAASLWLYHMTQSKTGFAPNLGGNDGSLLFDFTGTDYRDMRPSVQLACAMFCNSLAYSDEGPWNTSLDWLNQELPTTKIATTKPMFFPDGGYALLIDSNITVLFNIPKFKFRPSHADALHIDLWQDGVNLLGDAGSFSYALDDEVKYFSGTESHNTVQFDGRDQMPRINRFLFGEWLEPERMSPQGDIYALREYGAGYTDYKSAKHYRRVSLNCQKMMVTDEVSGFKSEAVLRWRLFQGEWNVIGNSVTNGIHKLSVESNVEILRFSLVDGWKSDYYVKKEKIQVLEVEIAEPGVLKTQYIF